MKSRALRLAPAQCSADANPISLITLEPPHPAPSARPSALQVLLRLFPSLVLSSPPG